MKRKEKSIFFIVLVLILGLAYTAVFGVYSQYGDKRIVYIRGADGIRTGIDIRGGVDVTFGPKDDDRAVTNEEIEGIRTTIEQRMISNNITDYEIYTDTDNARVIVRYPWKSDEQDYNAEAAVQELGKTARLTFHIGTETQDVLDENKKPVKDAYGNTLKESAGELVLEGKDIASAQAQYQQDPSTGSWQPVVVLTLEESGKKAFASATKQQAASKGAISIWFDNVMISKPTVNEEINSGSAVITMGDSDFAEASDLANYINAGALPFEIESKTVNSIDPSLGDQSLQIMIWAGIIAFILIAVFMILYYRLPGAIACIALIGQVAGSLAAVSGYFSFLNSFTLTLPGIAGIILSMGMGVDANVIMAERIKEELRDGRTIDGALSRGSKSSFAAIFDGNITNVIVAVILMGVFGPPNGFWSTILKPILMWFPVSTTGAIYSFGYTLIVGIIFNFIMGVGATRLMLRSITRFKAFRKPWLLGGARV